MLCNECNKNEAQITYTMIENNEVKEVHICHECMQKFLTNEFQLPFFQDPNMGKFFQQFFSMFVPEGGEKVSDVACPYCGHSLREFQKTSFLGCEHCYESFKEELSKLIPRLQGATDHKGYIPENFQERQKEMEEQEEKIKNVTSEEPIDEIEELKAKLNLAVEEERYEDAASYRDQIKKLEESDIQ